MADYIKREDAINIVKKMPGHSYGPNGPTTCYASSWLLDPSWGIHELQMLPAAEVRENVRGDWEPVTDANGYHDSDEEYGLMYRCPYCGGVTIGERNYCPDCGAYLRKVGEE